LSGPWISSNSIESVAILQRLNREQGLTIVMVTHEPDIAAFCLRNIYFLDGQITLDDAVAHPRHTDQKLSAPHERA
jgi:putative ABC transport system ATP-binding protein